MSVIRDLERLIRAARRKRTAHDGESAYRETERGIVWEKPTADGDTTPVLLTNFTATITAVTTRDDGAEQRAVLRRRRRLRRRALQRPGAGGRVRPDALDAPPAGQRLRPARAGAPGGGGDPRAEPRRRRAAAARAHGLATRGRTDVYLHGGGAVGSEGSVDGVTVDLGENARWRLVEPQFDHEVEEALAASVAVLDLAPLRVTAPLLGSVARAVLSTADFTLYLHGRTGVFKSELAALAQQHFGPELTARNLISFESTANSLEERAFVLKDALCVIDDYVTNGTPAEVAEMRRKAGRIVRAQGNLAGRGRLDRTSKARPARAAARAGADDGGGPADGAEHPRPPRRGGGRAGRRRRCGAHRRTGTRRHRRLRRRDVRLCAALGGRLGGGACPAQGAGAGAAAGVPLATRAHALDLRRDSPRRWRRTSSSPAPPRASPRASPPWCSWPARRSDTSATRR